LFSHLCVLLGLAIALACGCGGPAFVAPDRVLLLSIDTLRADHVGCYGASDAHTPNLDTIAASGVRFEVALSPVPLTLPAHASLLTGLEPPAHGVRHNSIHRLGAGLPTLAERMRDAGHATAAFVGALVLDRRFGLDRGFDAYDDRTSGRVSAGTGYAERPADEVVEAALAWLETAPDRFFLWVHFYDPHMAYEPPAGFKSAFASHPYAGEIAFVDAEIGRLLSAIRARWGEAGLLVVATSDHGESLGEHGETSHSYTIYEATQRVPLMLSGPGLEPGGVEPGPASLLDVAPTILAWVGAQPLPGTPGRDLRELLGSDELDPRSLYMETVATQLDFGWSALLGVRSGRFKYIRAPRPELYDLALDPGETRNRVAEEPARAAELDELLERHLAGPRRAPQVVELPEEDRARLRSLGYLVPEPSDATSTLGRVGGTDPKDAMGVLQELSLAQADLHAGRPEQALERLRALDDTATSVVAHRAAAALAAGDPAAAARAARTLLAREPGRTDMRILLARALAEQGRQGEADLALAALEPDAAPAAWVALGAARGELAGGRNQAALRRLELARARHPDDLSLAQAHGNLLEAAVRLDEALQARETALALAPEDPGAANDVAWTLALLGRDLERAQALARRAIAEAGDDPALLDTLATVLLRQGDRQGALDAIERALPEAQGETRAHLLELRAEAAES
jgi:arylsulfatase A-like enzyme/Flp pilus assembly protein TadD